MDGWKCKAGLPPLAFVDHLLMQQNYGKLSMHN
jgi:hypothetical protein